MKTKVFNVVPKSHYLEANANVTRFNNSSISNPRNQIFQPEEWADEIGRKIAVALVKGGWDQARDIIDYEERQRIPVIKDVYATPIGMLKLPVRVINYLKDVRPNTFGGLAAMNETELRRIPNVGELIVNNIKNFIQGVRNVTVNGAIKGKNVDRFFQ